MKFAVLAGALLAIFPLALAMRASPFVRANIWIALGVLPFLPVVLPFLDVALISWHDTWIGYSTGLMVSGLDVLALGLYFIVSGKRLSFSYHLPFLIYLSALFISMAQAEFPLAAFFVVWQFIRIYFFTVVIARASTDTFVVTQLLKGLAIGLALQFFAVVWQKFALGEIGPAGTLTHRNALGLVSHLVIFPHLAMLLGGHRTLQSGATFVMGLGVAALIASRAAVGFVVLGSGATYLLSLCHDLRRQKFIPALVGTVAVALLAPIAIGSLEERFESTPLSEDLYDERAAFNRAALLILDAYPMGTGSNHYPYVGRNYGYSISAGVVPFEGNLNNIVHNAYLLAAAETGYFGVVAFSFLMVFPILVAFRYAWAARGDPRGDILLGSGVGLTMVALHSFYEYIIVIRDSQYILAIVVGITFGLAHQLKAERVQARSRRRRHLGRRAAPA